MYWQLPLSGFAQMQTTDNPHSRPYRPTTSWFGQQLSRLGGRQWAYNGIATKATFMAPRIIISLQHCREDCRDTAHRPSFKPASTEELNKLCGVISSSLPRRSGNTIRRPVCSML